MTRKGGVLPLVQSNKKNRLTENQMPSMLFSEVSSFQIFKHSDIFIMALISPLAERNKANSFASAMYVVSYSLMMPYGQVVTDKHQERQLSNHHQL